MFYIIQAVLWQIESDTRLFYAFGDPQGGAFGKKCPREVTVHEKSPSHSSFSGFLEDLGKYVEYTANVLSVEFTDECLQTKSEHNLQWF